MENDAEVWRNLVERNKIILALGDLGTVIRFRSIFKFSQETSYSLKVGNVEKLFYYKHYAIPKAQYSVEW